jgi:formate-dependent nitrite reductase membrane component NrfD
MVPRAEPRSYYGQPVIKAPVWSWEVPIYFFSGGLAGASAALAWGSELRGNDELARRAWALALGGITASPALLISDLGRPERFLNMLRMFKVTSPMSVGSWLLAATGAAITPAVFESALPAAFRRRLPRPVDAAISLAAPPAKPVAALLGLPLSTYTAALVANTSVPVWHEARWTLPFLFGAGACASAGAAACLVTPAEHVAAARRLALAGTVGELAAARAMEQRLGELAQPYHEGVPGTLARVAQLTTAAGGMALAAAGARRDRLGRAGLMAGGALIAAGAFLERWAVFRAGFASAADPRSTVGPQRERIARGQTRGAARSTASPSPASPSAGSPSAGGPSGARPSTA